MKDKIINAIGIVVIELMLTAVFLGMVIAVAAS